MTQFPYSPGDQPDNNADGHDLSTRLRADLQALVREHDAYRVRVRDRAIQGYHDDEFSLEGLNDTLQRLGLKPYQQTSVTRASASIEFTITLTDSTSERVTEAVRAVESPELVTAFRRALAAVVAGHTSGDLGLALADVGFRVSVGAPVHEED